MRPTFISIQVIFTPHLITLSPLYRKYSNQYCIKIADGRILKTSNELNKNKYTGPDKIPVEFMIIVVLIFAEPTFLLPTYLIYPGGKYSEKL